MIRVVSANLNGIRSAQRKGFFDWLAAEQFDVICVQEVRAHMEHLKDAHFYPEGYYHYFIDAEKKGYSGVGIYSKKQPDKIVTKLGWDVADKEGRYIQADFGKLSIASVYLPSGTSGEGRQDVKYDFLDRYEKILKKQRKEGRHYILCGDWNIAHKEIDIKNWRTNQKTSGFLPEERAWLDKLFNEIGFVDAFRVLNQEPDQYTWWSQRNRDAYANNVGWRIDYQIISPELKSKVSHVEIYKDQKFSDHAPLIIDYAVKI
jgi:exodeoxyribonuclease III